MNKLLTCMLLLSFLLSGCQNAVENPAIAPSDPPLSSAGEPAETENSTEESQSIPTTVPQQEETKPTGSFDSQKGPNPQLIFSGKYDDQVKELQVMLNRADNAGLVVDGIFGVKTYAAVKKYTVELFDMGPLIGLVQRRLNKLGFDAGEADGYAEQPTMDGIARFQKAYGLGVGYLGGSDWYFLFR